MSAPVTNVYSTYGAGFFDLYFQIYFDTPAAAFDEQHPRSVTRAVITRAAAAWGVYQELRYSRAAVASMRFRAKIMLEKALVEMTHHLAYREESYDSPEVQAAENVAVRHMQGFSIRPAMERLIEILEAPYRKRTRTIRPLRPLRSTFA